MEPFLAALEGTIQQAVAQRQQQAQQGGPPGQGSPPGGPGGPQQGPGGPQQPQLQQQGEGGPEPGAGAGEQGQPNEQAIEQLTSRYLRTAGGPQTREIGNPPETTL